jgi:hypothetical protein
MAAMVAGRSRCTWRSQRSAQWPHRCPCRRSSRCECVSRLAASSSSLDALLRSASQGYAYPAPNENAWLLAPGGSARGNARFERGCGNGRGERSGADTLRVFIRDPWSRQAEVAAST